MRKNTDRHAVDKHTETGFPTREGLELLLRKSAWETIQREMADARRHDRETGGILIGGRSKTNVIYGAKAAGPGPNATHHRTEFSPDVEHSQRKLDNAREELDVLWIGTWHKHPGNMLSLSGDDIEQMKRLVRDPDTLNEIVSVILTENNGSVRARGYHMDDSLEAYHLPIQIVPDDAPIRKEFEWDTDPIQTSGTGHTTANRGQKEGRDKGSQPNQNSSDGTTETSTNDGNYEEGKQNDKTESAEGDTDFVRGGGESGTGEETSASETGAVMSPKLHIAIGIPTSRFSDSDSDVRDEPGTTSIDESIDSVPLDSDGSLRQSDGRHRMDHVPRTATEWGVLAAGTRALNDLYRPGYEPKQFDPSRDEARATLHDDGRVTFKIVDETSVESSIGMEQDDNILDDGTTTSSDEVDSKKGLRTRLGQLVEETLEGIVSRFPRYGGPDGQETEETS